MCVQFWSCVILCRLWLLFVIIKSVFPSIYFSSGLEWLSGPSNDIYWTSLGRWWGIRSGPLQEVSKKWAFPRLSGPVHDLFWNSLGRFRHIRSLYVDCSLTFMNSGPFLDYLVRSMITIEILLEEKEIYELSLLCGPFQETY